MSAFHIPADCARPDDTPVRVTFLLSQNEAVDLFTVLNVERDSRFDGARCPADIKAALGFHQLVGRLQAAYIKAEVIESD